jgi:rhodanese-related sulfurtransferase
MKTIIGIATVAAVATAADAIWYTFGIQHTIVAGVVHGALLLTVVGGVLGSSSGRLIKGFPIGAVAGIGGAASYYALILLMDGRTYGSAIPAAWVSMWLILAALDGRWLRAPEQRPWAAIAARALAAAVFAGLAFYFVMTTLWGTPPAGGRNYLVQFLAWAFAWTPGLIALTAGSGAPRASAPRAGSATAPPPTSARVANTSSATTASELLVRIDRSDTLHILDVRSEGEFAAGHVPGAVNIPFTQLPSRIGDVPGADDDELVLYCGHGPRAYIAAATLQCGGRKRIVYLTGHWAGWQAAGLRVER